MRRDAIVLYAMRSFREVAMRSDELPQMMTVAQVARYLQLTRITVRRCIMRGLLPASRIGKSYRIRRSDLDEFLEAAKVRVPA